MTDFFVQTDAGSSGPFTGIELREAALAGLLTPETTLSSSPTGPWTPAYEAGLFSERRVPLPHPAGVTVPLYDVSGLSESFRGPFKLRELIGFAARGLLPADAELRAPSSAAWIPVTRINIIAATLHGELALIDGNGKVIRRTSRTASHATQSGVRAPVTIAKAAVHSPHEQRPPQQVAALPEQSLPKPTLPPPLPVPGVSATPDLVIASRSRRFLRDILLPIRRYDVSLSPAFLGRIAVALTLVLIVATGGYAITQRKPTTIPREVALGDWLLPSGDEMQCHCGLSLRADGKCVVFNSQGPCWTGRFRWIDRTDDTRGLRGLDTTLELDSASPHHVIEPVGQTDGYLRFVSEGDSLPIIDGHEISDAFVQQLDHQLRLGYLVSIDISPNRKQLNAAWVSFNKPVSTSSGGHAKEFVIEQLPQAQNLVMLHGMPDEARPIQSHEVPREKMAERYQDAQLIRYGNHRFALTTTESWQPVTLAYPSQTMK